MGVGVGGLIGQVGDGVLGGVQLVVAVAVLGEDLVVEDHEGVPQMDVLHHHLGGRVAQLHTHVVPESLDLTGHKAGGDVSDLLLGAGDDRNIHLMLGAEVLQSIQCQHLDTRHGTAHKALTRVEHGEDIHPALLEHGLVDEAAAQVSRAHDDGMEARTDAQNLADLGEEVVDIIAVALLTKAAEAVEILTDLGGGDVHHGGQLSRGDPHLALGDELTEVAVVAGEALDDGGGGGWGGVLVFVIHGSSFLSMEKEKSDVVRGGGVQRGIGSGSLPVLKVPRGGDHGGVVAAEVAVGDDEADTPLLTKAGESRADVAVGGDASREDEGGDPLGLGGQGFIGLLDDALDDGVGIGGGQVGAADGLPLLLGLVDEVEGGGLETAEGEVQVVSLDGGAGEGEGLGVALVSQLVQSGTAGVGHTDDAADLIEGLAAGVIAGGTDLGEGGVVLHHVEGGMAARDHHGQEGGLQVGLLEVGGGHVAVDVVDGDQGDTIGVGQGLGEVDPHQKSADEAGMGGDSHRTHVGEGDARPVQSFLGDTGDGLNVGTAGDLGDHAAVETVGLDLGGHDIGPDGAEAVGHFHYGGGGLVAGAFHAEYVHIASFPRRALTAGAVKRRGSCNNPPYIIYQKRNFVNRIF